MSSTIEFIDNNEISDPNELSMTDFTIKISDSLCENMKIIEIDELYKYAIDIDYRALEFVKNQTNELCLYAIDKDYRALEFVKNQTDELCSYAISKKVEK